MSQRCVKCGRVWPDALVDKWGEDGHGDGYGSQPRCVGLRPARGVRHGAPDPQEVCGGALTSSSAQIDQQGTQVNGRPVPPA